MSQPTKQTPLDFFGYQTKFNTQNWNKKEIKPIIERKQEYFFEDSEFSNNWWNMKATSVVRNISILSYQN